VDQWSELYPKLDILNESRRALAWVLADPMRKKTARGMKRFLTGWFGRSSDRTRGGSQSTNNGDSRPGSFDGVDPSLFDRKSKEV
jgi:hypothetical protein